MERNCEYTESHAFLAEITLFGDLLPDSLIASVERDAYVSEAAIFSCFVSQGWD